MPDDPTQHGNPAPTGPPTPAPTSTLPPATTPAPAPVPAPPASPPAAAPAPASTPPATPRVVTGTGVTVDPDAPLPEGDVFDRAYVEQLRAEAAGKRKGATAAEHARDAALAQATAAQQAQTDFATKLNELLNPGSTTPAPSADELASQLAAERQKVTDTTAQADAKIRALQVENALPAVTARLEADYSLTTAVLKASGQLDKLDPASDTFGKDLESAVQAALEANPRLKVTPVVTQTGTEPTGRSGGSNQITREQLQGMSPEEITKAQAEGRLKNLLGGGA